MAEHRHQSSLENIINFSAPVPLTPDQRARARRLFYTVVEHFKPTDSTKKSGYRRPLLVRYTYEYSRSDLSKDTFLRAFFSFLNLDVSGDEDPDLDNEDQKDQLGKHLSAFADFLIDNFFLPSQELCISIYSSSLPIDLLIIIITSF